MDNGWIIAGIIVGWVMIGFVVFSFEKVSRPHDVDHKTIGEDDDYYD